jgi:hypothetical protein
MTNLKLTPALIVEVVIGEIAVILVGAIITVAAYGQKLLGVMK